MKDAYSFDRDEEGLDAASSARAGVPPDLRALRARVRTQSRPSRESWAARSPSTSSPRPGPARTRSSRCENGDYAADLEIARGVPRAPSFPSALDAPEEVETPGVDDDRGARRLARDRRRGDLEGDARREERRHARARARPRRRPALRGEAARRRSARDFRPATDDEIRRHSAQSGGSLGPVGFAVEVVADEALRDGQYVAGANRTAGTCAAWRRAATTSRASPTSASPRGRRLPDVRRRAPLPDGDRGRPHLQVRDALLRAARRHVPRRGRHREAAHRRQLRDRPRPRAWRRPSNSATTSDGIVWPAALAPYDVHVVVARRRHEEIATTRPRSRRRSMRRASRSCSTTATSGRARSSPTPTSSAAPAASPSARRRSKTARSTCRRRDGAAEDRVQSEEVLKWARDA